MHKVLIIDTSIMCVWLNIPGMNIAGKNNEHTYEIVSKYIDKEKVKGTKLVIPIAVIIETGNHIAHIKGNKQKYVNEYCKIIKAAINGESPWTEIDFQSSLWERESLLKLVDEWSKTAISESQSIGDAAIVQVANKYATIPKLEVEIYTADGGLKKYEYKIQGEMKRQLRRNRSNRI
jgi:hypothetical protein